MEARSTFLVAVSAAGEESAAPARKRRRHGLAMSP
jgi:hypothetical protein